MSRGRGKRGVEIIATATSILEEIQPASVRAICYRLFVAGLIPNMAKSATNAVSRMLTQAREAGEIPWEWIVDESREAEVAPRWSGPEAIIRSAVRQYRKDYWQDQDFRVEVWSEKGTVRGTLAPVLDEYGVTFRVMHGYASATVINEIATYSMAIEDKPLVALYVGDWDPSGKHMSDVDLPERLEKYGAAVDLERVALLHEDLRNLPSFSIETKSKDPRYRWFRDEIGTACYELDAMPPPGLRARVTEMIESYIDLPLWEHAKAIEAVEVESMEDFHKSWQASICSGGQT
ncbi:MAG: hypothetical protein ACREU3_17730 [Steroidobacteraceae bacterium]